MENFIQMLRDLRNGILVGLLSVVLFVGLLGVLVGAHKPGEPIRVETAAETNDGVPVFCYHFLRENTGTLQFLRILGSLLLNLPLLNDLEVWTQTEAAFDRQMAYLKEQGYETIGMRELVAWRHGVGELPPRPVVITFDDGDRSVIELAYPILQKYGFTATLYIPTAYVGTEWEYVDGMDWDEIRELEKSGVFTVESHAHELHYIVDTDKGEMPAAVAASRGLYMLDSDEHWRDVIVRDLRRSRTRIQAELGHDSRYLAWPYGGRNSELDSLAVAAGFHALSTLDRGMVRRYNAPDAVVAASGGNVAPQTRWQRFEIRRFTITARTSLRSFRKMLDDSPPPGSTR